MTANNDQPTSTEDRAEAHEIAGEDYTEVVSGPPATNSTEAVLPIHVYRCRCDHSGHDAVLCREHMLIALNGLSAEQEIVFLKMRRPELFTEEASDGR